MEKPFLWQEHEDFKHLNLVGPESSEIYENFQENNKNQNLGSVIHIQMFLGDIFFFFFIIL